MADQDPKTPAQGPVPDPHADEPLPRPDPHTRPEALGAGPRPDQYEELGPMPELLGAAVLEAATRVSHDPGLREEAIRRGAEVEGLETAQIFGLLLATAVVLAVAVGAVAILMTQAGTIKEQRRLADVAYPELQQIQTEARERLTTFGVEEGRIRIPLEHAQMLMVEEARLAPPPDIMPPETHREFNLAVPQLRFAGGLPVPERPEDDPPQAEPPALPAPEPIEEDPIAPPVP